jgi:hypothetical protein
VPAANYRTEDNTGHTPRMSRPIDNIFAALGLPDADEWLRKAELARALALVIR